MNNQRLGFLTPPGLIAAGLTVIIIVTLSFLIGGVIFSPGNLNAQPGNQIGGFSSHAEFSGQCRACHAPFWDLAGMDARCKACHTSITTEISNSSSLHGAISLRKPTNHCRDCHPDHRGRNASLTEVRDLDFPHEIFGFSLTGHTITSRGRSFRCDDCHNISFTTFNQSICVSCHEEKDDSFLNEHTLTFGSNCLECHDGIDTYGSLFDHNSFPFGLTGKHRGIPCSACHQSAFSITDLKVTPSNCFSCHQEEDVHETALGASCETCHTAGGWIPSTYSHTASTFQLTGKHIGVPCKECHTDKIFAATPSECFSCHAEDDIHTERFGSDCGQCHEVTGWIPALFDHNLSTFKLTGAHISTPCESCHAGKVYRGTPTDCFSCHAGDDAHMSRYGTSCGSCHTTTGWLPASFDHNLSSFKLSGAHAGLPCGACHSSGIYLGLASACAACHADPPFHAGLFSGMDCNQCHNTTSWTPASFNLSHPGGCDGPCISHEGASCRDCHTNNLTSYTCLKCHDSNSPDDD